jgi:hypothetical protein
MTTDPSWRGWSERLLAVQGSTRPAALLRIAAPLLVWSGWGTDLILCRDLSWVGFLICASFWISTSAMVVGYRSRLASGWAGMTSLAIVYVFGSLHRREAFAHHHTTLLAFVMAFAAFTPCGGSYSVDRVLAVRRAEARGEPIPAERGSLWGMSLVALQLSAVYFHALIYLSLPVQTFSLAACLLYLAFLPADDVHAFIDRYFQRS